MITRFVKKKFTKRYYKIHDICIEEVKLILGKKLLSKGELQPKLFKYVELSTFASSIQIS